ncbi:MAG: hypothetical protein R3E96_05545 [Planctomycetota bacterium]
MAYGKTPAAWASRSPTKGASRRNQGRVGHRGHGRHTTSPRACCVSQPRALLHQQAGCAITKSIISTNWRSYGLTQPKGSLPIAPMAIMVLSASVWVPFTSESRKPSPPTTRSSPRSRRPCRTQNTKLGIYILRANA